MRHFQRCFRLVLLVVCVLMFCAAERPLAAQDSAEKVDLSSPYGTIRTHLIFLQEKNYKPDSAALTLNMVDNRTSEAREIAVKLKEFLDFRGLLVEMDKVPTNSAYIDTSTGEATFTPFHDYPTIYVEKVGKRWLYSESTVNAVPVLWEQTQTWTFEEFISTFDSIDADRYFGLKLGHYVTLFLILALAFVFHRILSFVLTSVILRYLEKWLKGAVAVDFIHQVARPLSYLIVYVAIIVLVPTLKLPPFHQKYLQLLLQLMASIYGIMIFYRVVDLLGAYFEKIAEKTESTLDDHLVPLARTLTKILVVLGGIALILQNWGINITALLAGLSIGGLAFAFAAQDTIRNFFGSIMIFVDKPFQIGDWVVFDGGEGTVEEVGIRSTRVRTFYNSLVYVPNGKLADMMVDNMGLRQYRRFNTKITITYSTSPEQVDAFVQGLRRIVDTHPNTRKDYYQIFFNNMSATSLDVLFYIFFEVPDWTEELRARHDVLLAIMNLAKALGVEFAFPTETIHIDSWPAGNAAQLPVDSGGETNKMAVAEEEDFRKSIDAVIADMLERNRLETQRLQREREQK